VARHRQRARERKDRLHRDNVPGSLDHASGEVEEVEAAIVAGADGEPADLTDGDAAGLADDDRAGGRPATATAPRERLGAEAPVEGAGGGRFLNFLKACWAELQRVQWPDRRQVAQATAVVLGFVVVAGAFLGLADVVAEQIVDLII
jgi:preprotein translocase subunit SecE